MKQYYIARPGGEKQGPFPEATVRANRAHAGFYAPDTLAWCKGMEAWKPLDEVFGEPEPPKPVPAPQPAALPPAPKIYYIAERGGERQGPFTLAELLAWKSTFHTLAWKKGMAGWEPIAVVRAAARREAGAAAAPPPEPSLVPAPLRFFYPFLEGRISPARFWCGMGALVAASILLSNLCDLCDPDWEVEQMLWSFFVWLFLVPSFIAQVAGRLRDGGLSAWSALLFLIPLFGWLALFLLCCMPGDAGANKYGCRRPLC